MTGYAALRRASATMVACNAAELDEAIVRVLTACADFKNPPRRPKRGASVDPHKEIGGKIKALKRCAKVLSHELLTWTPTGPGISQQLSRAITYGLFQTTDHVEAINAFIQNQNQQDSAVQATLLTLGSVHQLIGELSRELDTEVVPVHGTPSKKLRSEANAGFRGTSVGEQLHTIPIGNPDAGGNPLLRFLMSVCTPIAGYGIEFPIRIPGGTLSEAMLQRFDGLPGPPACQSPWKESKKPNISTAPRGPNRRHLKIGGVAVTAFEKGDRVLSIGEVRALTNLSRTTIWRLYTYRHVPPSSPAQPGSGRLAGAICARLGVHQDPGFASGAPVRTADLARALLAHGRLEPAGWPDAPHMRIECRAFQLREVSRTAKFWFPAAGCAQGRVVSDLNLRHSVRIGSRSNTRPVVDICYRLSEISNAG